MRIVAISLCAIAFAAGPGLAGVPVGGIGVSVESTGGIRVQYANANDARAACVAARGTFSNTARAGLRCANPRRPLTGDARIPTNLSSTSPVTVLNSQE